MGYRKVATLEQLWYIFKYWLEAKLEWHKAVTWAKEFHPAWVEIHNRVQVEHVRQVYKNLILIRYREMYGGGHE